MVKKGHRVIISGGGTGGHIFPAIAIANEIKAQNSTAEILFVGALGRMEMERVPAAGFPIVGLPVTGLQRKSILHNITLPLKLLKSLRKAKKIIKDFEPDVAIGVGGYASWPLLWMATRMKIPSIIQEQNSYAGIANRMLSKRVTTICVASEGMERFFPKEKIRLTGNPIRTSIVPVTETLRQEGRAFFHISPNRKCILVSGGSLGARTLNECVKSYITESNGDTLVEIIWQCGGYYQRDTEAFAQEHPSPWVHLHPFIDRMDLAFAAADVVISRAGAGTISELCIAQKAVIFVPSPNVSEDHQTHNAMALVHREAAMMVPEDQALTCLMKTAIDLVMNEKEIKRLEQNISGLARPNATKDIVNQIIALL
ncbi:MAG: undecaprenyldiphospho-muramoylpentapeptide beta-N-acetylglucosaminyltransferase [Prevotellaceae bacterium]|jgi:UDP-N-acetylglucosamine--N-acetylmuramyl-(pentapeptide) pyrophosphoryl-undecaprenol N-acetylglucosamine transferase|nr:undecaprenyldiphospho-muramoylpentapeptide beta-N-acetylglucosaminyltransferase [Prevotellaceae bacterium]